jgi:uncharacterized protein
VIEIILVSVLLGIFSGLLAGLFGIGGGLIIVPVLIILFTAHSFPEDLVMLMAVATSLATIILTATASVLAHHRLGSVVWSKVFYLSPGIMAGAAFGAIIAKHISAGSLRTILAIFLLYVAIQMALQVKPKPVLVKQSRALDLLAASFIGLLSSIVGIGGGTLTVPYLVRGQMLMRNAVAVSSACGLPIAVAGTVSYAVLGWNALGLPEWSLGYVYLPIFIGTGFSSIATAPIGAKLAHKLPAVKLKRYFSMLLFVMAAKLIWY